MATCEQALKTGEDEIVEMFDALVTSQVVFYDENQRVEHMTDRGIPVC
jgi:hypothetical protein